MCILFYGGQCSYIAINMKKSDISDGIYFHSCALEYFSGFGLGAGDALGMNWLPLGLGA